MKNVFAVACLAALAQAQCCNTCACAPAPVKSVSKVRLCNTKMTVQLSTRQEVKTTWEKKERQVSKTIMEPVKIYKKVMTTVRKPVTVHVEKSRTDFKQVLRKRMVMVSENYQKSTMVASSCGCYQRSCACAGTSGCGCCQPACGCAPALTEQLTNHTRQVERPEHYYETVPFQVPYTEKQYKYVNEEVETTVCETVMKPRIQLSTIIERIPTHKTVDVVTKTNVPVETCKDVEVEDYAGKVTYRNATPTEITKVKGIMQKRAVQAQRSLEQARGKAMGTVYGSVSGAASSWGRPSTSSWVSRPSTRSMFTNNYQNYSRPSTSSMFGRNYYP